MNHATTIAEPLYKQKGNTTYKEWIMDPEDKDEWKTVLSPKHKSKMNQTTMIRPLVSSLGRGGGLTTIYILAYYMH